MVLSKNVEITLILGIRVNYGTGDSDLSQIHEPYPVLLNRQYKFKTIHLKITFTEICQSQKTLSKVTEHTYGLSLFDYKVLLSLLLLNKTNSQTTKKGTPHTFSTGRGEEIPVPS